MVEPTEDLTDKEVDDQIEQMAQSENAAAEPKTDEESVQQTPAEPKPETSEPKPGFERTVPHGAFHEERMRRKETQAELETIKAQNQRMEERFQQVLEKVNQPQEPTYEDDPTEALRVSQNKMANELANQRSMLEQRQEQDAQIAVQSNLQQRYIASASAYMQENPKFMEAYNFYTTGRINELVAAGYSHQEANQVVTNEEMTIAQKAYGDEVNPAERIFNLAKVRGYNSTKEVEQKIDTIEKGQNGSKTLTGSGQTQEELSLESLADMDDKEFDANWDKLVSGNNPFSF